MLEIVQRLLFETLTFWRLERKQNLEGMVNAALRFIRTTMMAVLTLTLLQARALADSLMLSSFLARCALTTDQDTRSMHYGAVEN
jgi:hypothetical protein